jgi:hypothetical protein
MIQKPIANSYRDQIALLNTEKPVRVYRNLQRKFDGENGFWSVKQGVVRFHCQQIFLKNVTFPVNERVRLEVVRDEVKQVHAYVQGFLCERPTYYDGYQEVTYNPYNNKRFVCEHGEVISAETCNLIRLSDGKMRVYASGILTEQVTPVMIDQVPVHML